MNSLTLEVKAQKFWDKLTAERKNPKANPLDIMALSWIFNYFYNQLMKAKKEERGIYV